MRMRDCEIRPFENCIRKVKYTNKIASQDFKPSGRFPIVSQEEAFISGYWDNPEDVFHIDGPVVIFGDHSRHIKYVDFDFVIGADGVKILAPVEDIVTKYLYYYLKSQPIQSLGYSRHYKVLKEKYVPVLSLAEQQRIVEELDLLSRVIELKNAQLRTLEDLSSAIFHEMFGDILSNEKMWETSTIGNEFKIYSGGTPDTKQPAYWENGNISWIGSNLCQNLVLYHNDGKFITEEGLSHSSAKVFSENFVLVALVGATIGKSALLRFKTTTNQNVAGIDVPSNEHYTSEFVYMMMRSLYPLFMNVSNGKFKMANLSFVRSLPIIKPPLSLQENFSERFSAIQRQKSNVEKSIVVAENLLASRMDKYFNE